MSVDLTTPGIDALAEAVNAMREWQHDADTVQLHPGDIGWHWRFGAEAAAAAVRTWRRDGHILAVGLVDDGVLRLAIAPDARQDEDLAHRMAEDVSRPESGLLPTDPACVEARWDGAFPSLLRDNGWEYDEPWTPLARDLGEPVPDCGLRIEVAGPGRIQDRVAAHLGAFDRSTFTEERWHAMAAGPAYADARCLVGYDDHGNAVAAATVWSAGPGRPGLLEPLGAHRDHRGHGHGRAIAVAAAAALREMGSSSATVCTPAANTVGVITYRSAGYRQLPDVRDLRRGSTT